MEAEATYEEAETSTESVEIGLKISSSSPLSGRGKHIFQTLGGGEMAGFESSLERYWLRLGYVPRCTHHLVSR